ncbi:hypothetical protein CVT24_006451 [Panaeolus cyanescens]|uniref:Uncharacterized protein n=1 Tax=Panaeolus cyanescens TaxID=181874 RepID=A0A409WZC6_9AGAR|nr:hypothetical protein CVT24_006451 [Panaeolus cyanescens]
MGQTVNSLQDTVKQKDESIKTLQEQLATASGSCTRLQEDLRQNEKQLMEERTRTKTAEDTLTEQTTRLRMEEKVSAKHFSSFRTAEDRARLLSEQLERLKEQTNANADAVRVQQLEVSLREKDAIIIKLREQISGSDVDNVMGQEQRISDLERDVEQLTRSNTELRTSLTTVENSLRDALASEDNLRKAVRDAKEDLTRQKEYLTTRMNDYRSQADQLRQSLLAQSPRDATMGCAVHDEEIKRLQDALAVHRDEIQTLKDSLVAASVTAATAGNGSATDDDLGSRGAAGPGGNAGNPFEGRRPNDPLTSSAPNNPPPPPFSAGFAVPFIPSTENILSLVDSRVRGMEERLGQQIQTALSVGSQPQSKRGKKRRPQAGDDLADDEEDGHEDDRGVGDNLTPKQQTMIRNATYSFFGIKKKAEEAFLLPYVPQAELEAYRQEPEERNGALPELSVPYRPDWTERWGNYNKSLGVVFMQKWTEDATTASEKIPDDIVLGHFRTVLGNLIRNRRSKGAGTVEEVSNRETRTKKNNRRGTRRHSLGECRIWMINYKIETARNESERVLFVYMKRALETAGPDSVSSDETDGGDRTGNTYNVRHCRWKSTLLTDIEKFVDANLYAKVGQQGTSGRKLRLRIREKNSSSQRPAPVGLPSNFYSGDFIQGRDPIKRAELKVKQPIEQIFFVLENDGLDVRLLQ